MIRPLPTGRLGSVSAVVGLCLLAICLSAISGCGGCSKNSAARLAAQKKKEEDEKKRKKKKPEKPKPPFEALGLRIQPSDGSTTKIQTFVKPGHWLSAEQQIRSNDRDFLASLESSTVNSDGKIVAINDTPFQLNITRPAVLPKGQVKVIDLRYYIPRMPGLTETAGSLRNHIRSRPGGGELVPAAQNPTLRMPAHQYHFVVLAREPDRYGYVKLLDSTILKDDELDSGKSVTYYRVTLPDVSRRVPLPSHPLTWTAIAYVLWDEVDPNILTPDQQQALLDWLHWGGQLVVSGPNSLDLLKDSFLDPYLPAQKVKAVGLQADDFQELNENWSLQVRHKKKLRERIEVLEEKPPAGVELRKLAGGAFVTGTGRLVAERRVGGGRIVVTAFSLTDRLLVNWPSYDSFFNGALLRRPARKYHVEPAAIAVHGAWVTGDTLNEPRLSSTLRYFTRDVGRLGTADAKDGRFAGYTTDGESGVAGWNDHSGAADLARKTLRNAGGVKIPRADFVFKVLVVYLLVLVPCNWGLFWTLGRVEWAWFAAPLIAVGGGISVVKLAQLDIGFARSQTELGVVEIQSGYSRAHVTRYVSLYTSLSTSYTVHFDDDSPLALPMGRPNYTHNQHDPLYTINYRRDKEVSARGFQVLSNSADMVHCEQMLDLGGKLELVGNEDDGFQLNNGTQQTLEDAAILRRSERGELQVAWLGKLQPKSGHPASFQAADEEKHRVAGWETSPVTSSEELEEGAINLRSLIDLATERLRLANGESRLVGWTADELKGITVRPRAAQALRRYLVVAHLRRAAFSAARPDDNLRIDIEQDEPKFEESGPTP